MTTHGHHARPSAPPRLFAVVGMLVATLTVVLIAFTWPAVRSQPRSVPIVVTGTADATRSVLSTLALEAPGTFEPAVVPDREAATTAIAHRDAYGAIVAGPDGTELLTASAASPAVAQFLTQYGARLRGTGMAPIRITDVVPAPAQDPRGGGLLAGAIPLLLGGIAGSLGLARLVRSPGKRLVGGLAFSVLGGLVLTAVEQYWLGALTGRFWANAGVVALGIGSILLCLLGLARLGGIRPLALGAAFVLLVGNPLSGLATAPELLPTGWGAFGQYLPPGATATALRSVAFFDGSASARPLIVLIAWCLAGLGLCALGAARHRLSTRLHTAPVLPGHAVHA